MKYQIRYEKTDGEYYYVIYRKAWFWWVFFERWDYDFLVKSRVEELTKR